MKAATLTTILFLVLLVGGGWLVWEFGFCRFYVPPGYMAVLTAKEGDLLQQGQILAKPGQRGVLEDVLGEGRHFRNPYTYDWHVVPAVVVPPGKVGVVTSKVGQDLPAGEFLADAGQKGIWKRVLGPGHYRLNPQGYSVEIIDATVIPIGYVGVLTSLAGEQPKVDGGFAAAGEKGVQRDILQPGLYYINPKQYRVDVLEIGVNQVSLLADQRGQLRTKGEIQGENSALAAQQANMIAKQQQRRDDYVQANKGNSFVESLDNVSQSVNSAPQQMQTEDRGYAGRGQAAAIPENKPKRPSAPSAPPPISGRGPGLAHNEHQGVSFPSRDGFKIDLDITVTFELDPAKIAEVFRTKGDLPAVLDNIIMPQILSVSRIKGSAHKAQEFVVGEGREQFQTDVTDALAAVLKEKDITMHHALIRNVTVPAEILQPIQQKTLALEQSATNGELQKTQVRQAELNTQESMIEQKKQQVVQETEKLVAQTKADQDKLVAEIGATTAKEVAEVQKKTAGVRADKTRILGKAAADVIKLVEGETAKGYTLKILAYNDPEAYNLVEFANALNPEVKVNIIHTGAGTLWTDLRNATFSDLAGAKALGGEKAPPGK